jgi:hypothetical protein
LQAAAAEANTSAEAAAAAEAANLESTLSRIDKLLLDMAVEDTVAAAEEVMATVPNKGKKIYPRPKRRSYRSMVYHVATSQEPCSLVGSMKRP